MAEEIIEAAEEIEAELFPPRPGGLVDRHRQRKAAQRAAQDLAEQEQVPVEGPSYRAVKVAPESPEVLSAITYTIAAGGQAMILPSSPYRYRATVLVVTAASTIVIAKDSGQALGQAGFVLPSGVPLPVNARAQLWAYNNSVAPVQVSVLAEIYAPEQHAAPAARAPDKHHGHAA